MNDVRNDARYCAIPESLALLLNFFKKQRLSMYHRTALFGRYDTV